MTSNLSMNNTSFHANTAKNHKVRPYTLKDGAISAAVGAGIGVTIDLGVDMLIDKTTKKISGKKLALYAALGSTTQILIDAAIRYFKNKKAKNSTTAS